jgi:hypothetical protein
MKSFSLERLPKDGIERQEILSPETPEHPSIYVRKKKEQEYFEAEFGLELVGVTRDRSNIEIIGRLDEQKQADATRYRKSLVFGLSSNQGLQIVYAGGKDDYGSPCFNWKMVGISRGSSVEEVTRSARRLFQNLNVTLKAVRNDYVFVPAIGGFAKNGAADKWIGTVRPAGIEIVAAERLPAGFRNNHGYGKTSYRRHGPISRITAMFTNPSLFTSKRNRILSVTPGSDPVFRWISRKQVICLKSGNSFSHRKRSLERL